MGSRKTRFSTMLYFQHSETSDFQQIASLPTFIDKTLLIKYLLESDYNHWIITAPPGYGKSTNLDMIKRFVEVRIDEDTGSEYVFTKSENFKIFKKCKLYHYWELFFYLHSGTYLVIHLSLKGVYGSSMEILMEKFALKLCRTFKRHRYLKRSTILTENEKKRLIRYSSLKDCKKLTATEIEYGIVFLAEMLTKYLPNRNVYVLIDDYDYPITRFLQDTNEITDKIGFFRFFDSIFDSILCAEHKTFITRSLFTGVMPIGLKSIISRLPSDRLQCDLFPCTRFINDFYGITRNEVIHLLEQYDCYDDETEWAIILFYGSLLPIGKSIVNTHCFLRYLATRKFEDFCHLNNIFNFVENILHDHSIRYFIEHLLSIGWVFFHTLFAIDPNELISIREAYLRVTTTSRNFKAFLLCLIHYGCLEVEISHPCVIFRIANPFVQSKLRLAIINYYGDELNAKFAACLETFQQLFSNNVSNNSCAKFLRQYREIMIIYSRKFPWVKFFTVQCLLDIVVKCPTFIATTDETYNIPNQEELYLMLYHEFNLNVVDNTKKHNLILIHITFQSIITATLADIFNNKLYEDINGLPQFFNIVNLIFIGINTDENLKCSLGLLINDNDLNNARYYSYPNEN